MAILYFSGTGNSLSTAKKLAADGERIINVGKPDDAFCIEDKTIGIVFPVYCADMPFSMKKYLETAQLTAEYFYVVVTAGGGKGKCYNTVQYLLNRRGNKLSYGACILMPDSCIVFPTGEARKKEMLENHDARIEEIKTAVGERREFPIKPKKAHAAATRFMWKFFRKGLKTDKKYAGENCTRCGKCVKTCPTGNIYLGDNIEFGDNCDTCFGCVQICPSRAVRFGKLTVNDATSYHHIILDG